MRDYSITRSRGVTVSAGLLCGLLWGVSGAWAGDGLVALQNAAPSCPDDSDSRYVDCGNGTVTDNLTGQVWLKNASCFGLLSWDEAMAAVAGLSDQLDSEVCGGLLPDACDCGLADGSAPGEWRLPSPFEWHVMVTQAVELPCTNPAITNDTGDDCWDQDCVGVGNCSFYGVVTDYYWSSTTASVSPDEAWTVDAGGSVSTLTKSNVAYAWPVRAGQ